MSNRPSIRNIAAVARECITFSNAAHVDDININPSIKERLNQLAQRMAESIDNAALSHKEVTTIDLHQKWAEAVAPDLTEYLKEFGQILDTNKYALGQVVANPKGPEIDRITVSKLADRIDSTLRSERRGIDRDPGGYWHDPLMGIKTSPNPNI